ncbi:GNAT family N-acetyltransferase [Terrimonas rubra]|uniref:GNAT family N-acetyltransferase n=1 Tax=Terrimonas rubra TaxID=1035890 RepID=A0ABW6A8T8_9BACT
MVIVIDEHTRLEETAPEHAAGLLDAVNANRDHLSTFLPWVGAMQTVEDFERYIQQCQQKTAEKLEQSFVIVVNGVIAGRIGIHHIQPANQSGAIGYWLTREAGGKGVMLNCCRKIVEYGFSVLQLHRIEIKAATHNIKSQAIPQKLGFIREGVLRESERVNDVYFDIVLYAMLQHEWKRLLQ